MYALWLMETDWKAEIFKRLDALSEKLGVAASHLWQVLVRQGMAEAVANLIMAVCWLIILIVAAKVLLWARKTGELKRGDGRYNDWPGQYIFWTIVSSLTLVTSVGLFMSCVYDFTIWAVNPEYFAIQKVIELFK
jgi:uncharacterized membrane protein